MALPGIYDMFNKAWKDYQTIYIISDTHFGDDDLKKALPNRPSDDELVKLINSKVGKKDLLIHLGDVGDLEYMKKIRGHKILIAGNHEPGLEKYKEIFDMVFSGPVMLGEKLLLSHEPVPNVDWCMNLHGHVHDRKAKTDKYHLNVCADVIGYTPINFNQFLKSGATSKVKSLHRTVIDKASERKKKRGGRKIGEK